MFSKKFSIVFPSRGRTALLDNCIKSIIDNTFCLHDVEILVAIDNDDEETIDYSIHFPKGLPGVVKFFQVNRSLNFSRDYYSYLAKQSTGRWLICLNDDAEMVTKNWDALAYDVLKDQPGVIYGWIEDGIGEYRAKGHGDYCCFPLQGRVGVEALGYIFPADIPTWGADLWAKALYDQVGSVVKLPIEFKHVCVHNKTREHDAISKRIAENQVSFDVRPRYDQINTLLRALKEECQKV